MTARIAKVSLLKCCKSIMSEPQAMMLSDTDREHPLATCLQACAPVLQPDVSRRFFASLTHACISIAMPRWTLAFSRQGLAKFQAAPRRLGQAPSHEAQNCAMRQMPRSSLEKDRSSLSRNVAPSESRTGTASAVPEAATSVLPFDQPTPEKDAAPERQRAHVSGQRPPVQVCHLRCRDPSWRCMDMLELLCLISLRSLCTSRSWSTMPGTGQIEASSKLVMNGVNDVSGSRDECRHEPAVHVGT